MMGYISWVVIAKENKDNENAIIAQAVLNNLSNKELLKYSKKFKGNKMSEKYLSVRDAAKILDVSIWTIRKWVKDGILKHKKFVGTIRIKESDLLELGQESEE